MKRIIYISILLLNGFIGYSQCLVTENKEWSNLCHDYWIFWNYSTEHLKFTVDTVIDTKTYKKVERSIDEFHQFWFIYGYIREDSSKKVFYKLNAIDPEKLVYDFNAQLHDTLNVFALTTLSSNVSLIPLTYRVISIDSIQIGDKYRRQINLTNLQDSTWKLEHWIDSTGNLGGLLHNFDIYLGFDSYTLLCFSENGIIKYQNPDYNSCYVVTGIDNKCDTDQKVSIYPIPVTGSSKLVVYQQYHEMELVIEIIDLYGQIIYSKAFISETQINKSELRTGMYLFKIKNKSQEITRGKLIIN